jgi:PAS domain S-box-containing protein
METGLPVEAETIGVKPDGTRFIVRDKAFPLINIDGEIIGFNEVVEDITQKKQIEDEIERYKLNLESLVEERTYELKKEMIERKQAEEELRESEEKWRSLTENSPDYIMLLDIDYNIQFINHTVPGIMVEEVIGRPGLDFVPPNQHQIVIDCFERVIQSGKPDLCETQYITTEGETQYFDSRVAPVMDKDGNVAGFICNANNINDRKQAEEEKQNLQKQLQQSQKMESIGTLAGGIAHDFNNILGSIVLNSEMALEGIPENNDAKYLLEQVLYNSQRAKDLVKHILTFSRLEEVARKPLKISIVVKESLKMLRAMIPSVSLLNQDRQ